MEAHIALEVRAPLRALELGQRNVEACRGTEAAVEESEVEVDVAVGRGTEHDAATRGCLVQHLFHGLLAGHVGLALAGALHAFTNGFAVEELPYFIRYIGQLSVVRQFIADTQVGVGTDIYTDHGRLEVDEGESAALLLAFRITQIEVPPHGRTFLALLLHGDTEVKSHLSTRLEFSRLLGFSFIPLGLAVVIANLVGQAALHVLHQLVAFLLQFVELSLEFICNRLNVISQLRGICLGIHRNIECQVLVCVVVVIDDGCIGVHHAIDSLHVSVEDKGGQATIAVIQVLVVNTRHLEVALQRTLACRGAQSDAHDHANQSLLARGTLLVLIVATAVEVETARDARNLDGGYLDTRLASHLGFQETPGEGISLAVVVVVVGGTRLDDEELAR